MREATATVQQAVEVDEAGGREREAYVLYMEALNKFRVALKWETNPVTKELCMNKVAGYVKRAEYLREQLSAPKPAAAVPAAAGDETAKLRAALESLVLTEKPDVTWADVAGLDAAKMTLREAVILPQLQPSVFQGERKPWTGILLYGPPGTGKSFLAKAVANEAEATFMAVSSSSLVSKWQGESERLVRQMFEIALEKAPTVVFIDEVDSLCSERTDGENESSRRIKNELLVGWDRSKKDGQGRVVVLGATNTPWSLDPAMRRRFEQRVYVPLPDAAARAAILRRRLRDCADFTSTDIADLARDSHTGGYSGADMDIVARSALLAPLRAAQTARFFRVDADGKYTPTEPCEFCSQAEPAAADLCTACGARRMSVFDVPRDCLKLAPVTMDDVRTAVRTTQPSVHPRELKRFEEWATTQ